MISCTFENGKEAHLRHAVVDVLVVRDDGILLVKRAPHMSNGGKYGLIGGYIERNETVVQAACREVLEETGYKIKVRQLFRIKDNPDRRKEDKQNIAFVLIAEPLEKVQTGDSESTEVQWFSFNDLPEESAMAFDHHDDIQLYLRYKKDSFPLPISLQGTIDK